MQQTSFKEYDTLGKEFARLFMQARMKEAYLSSEFLAEIIVANCGIEQAHALAEAIEESIKHKGASLK